MRELFRPRRMWRGRQPLRDRYQVVIVGGGSHGLATAYYLAKHGITDVCVLEKGYIGSGAAGRNTAILRSNYRTAEGARFYERSLRLYERLSTELGYNLMFSQRGHMTVAHNDRSEAILTERAGVNRLLGIESEMVGLDRIRSLAPAMRTSPEALYPVRSALYHPPGGTIRHDAVVWGLARGADRAGTEVHPGTEVTGIERDNGRVTGVQTSRGPIATEMVVSCAAGWSTQVARLAGVPVPPPTSSRPSSPSR